MDAQRAAQTFAAVARAIGKQTAYTGILPSFADSRLTQAYYDRRGHMLAQVPPATVEKYLPKGPRAALAWEAIMDVYAGFQPVHPGLEGVRTNLEAANSHTLAIEGPSPDRYDREAFYIARAILRAALPGHRHHIDGGTEQAYAKIKKYSAFHFMLAGRLEHKSDMLAATVELKDAAAFAHIVHSCIEDDIQPEEAAEYYLAAGGKKKPSKAESEILTQNGFYSLRDLFCKSDPGKALRDILATNNRANRLIENNYGELRAAFPGLPEKMTKNAKEGLRKRLRSMPPEALIGRLNPHYTDHMKDVSAASARPWQIKRKKQQSIRLQGEIERYKWRQIAIGESAQDAAPAPRRRGMTGLASGYFVSHFVSSWDVTVKASKLIDAATAAVITAGLYKDFGEDILRTNAEGRRLARLLTIPSSPMHEDDQEEGILSPRALTRIVMDAACAAPYRRTTESTALSHDTAVTLLIDNSGSMAQDGKIQLAYIASERLAYWLGTIGIPLEILGFTTLPRAAGLSVTGRQDNLHHIIYKTHAEAYTRKTPQFMAAMLRGDLLQSNFDGEAVMWAHERLRRRAEKRRLLISIGDGYPAGNYQGKSARTLLGAHLQAAVTWIEGNSRTEILGIGIGKDNKIGDYYTKHIRIESAADLMAGIAAHLINEIDTPLASLRRAKRALMAAPKGLRI